MRMFVSLLAWGLSSVAMAKAPPPAPPAGAADGTRVLDRRGYFRTFVEFGLMPIDPDVLKAEGAKLFGAEALGRFRQRVRQLLAHKDIDWKKTDWRDLACYHFASTQAADDTAAAAMITRVAPPADWAGADFDDRHWLRQRLGFLSADMPGYGAARERYGLHRRALYYRTYFDVPDVSAAGEMTLTITYRGGVRVLLNGEEVARAHLAGSPKSGPPGDLPPGTLAEGYPPDAYKAMPDETPARYKSPIFAGDVRTDWAHATTRYNTPRGFRTPYGALAHLNEKGWERLRKLRDRVLGPVRLPVRLLRKGRNVLAVEVRTSGYHPIVVPGAGNARASNWAAGGANFNCHWAHLRLVDIALRCPSGRVPSCRRRPIGQGARVWVEDIHNRLFSRDFLPPGEPTGSVRIVAAANGTFAAQLAVGTGRDLTALRAVCGDLARDDGKAKIPASAVSVGYMVGHGIGELVRLGWFRSLNLNNPFCPMANVALYRYSGSGDIFDGRLAAVQAKREKMGGPEWRPLYARAVAEFLDEFKFFDHISYTPPARVPADTCQPIWLSLKVPADAQPGRYAGTLTVRAGGTTLGSVPLEVEVIGWRVPDPREFQTFVQSEQSPYGVARGYPAGTKPQAKSGARKGRRAPRGAKTADEAGKPKSLPLWSQEHWRLMETSFRQLARLGADWVFIPVLLRSELGNRDDSPIRWVRKADGGLAFDYTVMDRYLDLAVKHLGRPRVVCFLVMHGCASTTNAVKVLDESSGAEQLLELGPKAVEVRRPYWRAFATSLYAHMQARGLAQSMHWGHAFDRVYDPGLVKMLAEFTPGVFWAAGAHARRPDPTFRAVARSYGSDLTPVSLKGWKNPYVHLLMPRTGGSIICVEGTSTPFTWRVMCDRAIHSGMNGIGRAGADYFRLTWMNGFSGGEWLLVGRCMVQTLWPGKDRVESSARNEGLLEGIQEAEARIFLEQVLQRHADGGVLPGALAAEAQKVLDDHFRATLHVAAGGVDYETMDYHVGWQDRSRRLYGVAAKVARTIGMDVAPERIGGRVVQTVQRGQAADVWSRPGVPLPAMGRKRVSVTLRNWTGRPRKWTAAAAPRRPKPGQARRAAPGWIRPESAAGEVSRHEELPVVLDGKGLKCGDTVTGTLIVTDVATRRRWPVEITASVVEPFELRSGKLVFNVAPGRAHTRKLMLFNRTTEPQTWKLSCAAPWVEATPAAGRLAAESFAPVALTVRPPGAGEQPARAELTFTALGGAVRKVLPVWSFVVPPYRRPAAPAGRAVRLEEACKRLLVSHRSGTEGGDRPHFGGYKGRIAIGGKTFERALRVSPHHETVLKIAGEGFAAFSARVGMNTERMQRKTGHVSLRVNFEVHADGRLLAQSGLMKFNDPPRLLAADIAGAKELKLVTRLHTLGDGLADSYWAEPNFHKP